MNRSESPYVEAQEQRGDADELRNNYQISMMNFLQMGYER